MVEYIHLIGTESVERAASRIQSAAESISATAGNIENSLFRHRQYLEEWISRFEAAINKLNEINK